MSVRVNFSIPFSVILRYLRPLSLLYLIVPYIIFFAGWLKWYFVIPCVVLVTLPLFCLRGSSSALEDKLVEREDPGLQLSHILLLFLVALVVLGISGIGGYGYQDGDWPKHNAIFKDLVEQSWPVVYDVASNEVPLVYYIAFFLPAALVGKLGGWYWANHALFLWSAAGLLLAMLWFFVLIRRATVFVMLLFVTFSGLDAIGRIIITPFVSSFTPGIEYTWSHIEWWAVGWQYSSNATLLFWVPNQAIAAWIVSGMLMQAILYSREKRYHLFYLGLTALWSPFITVGVLPFLLADFLTEVETLRKRINNYLSIPNIAGAVLLMVTGAFYSAKFYEMPASLKGDVIHGFVFSFANNPIEMLTVPIMIVVFCILEFGIYGIIVHRSNPDWDRKTKAMLATVIVWLTLLPFYRYGYYNDLMMRAGIPSLFFLAVFLAWTLHNGNLSLRGQTVLLALIVIGSVTALVEYRRHFTNILEAGTILQQQEVGEVSDLWKLQEEVLHGPSERMSTFDSFIFQYVGSSQAPFFELMTRQPQYQPVLSNSTADPRERHSGDDF